jgi:hypothetical protein
MVRRQFRVDTQRRFHGLVAIFRLVRQKELFRVGGSPMAACRQDDVAKYFVRPYIRWNVRGRLDCRH